MWAHVTSHNTQLRQLSTPSKRETAVFGDVDIVGASKSRFKGVFELPQLSLQTDTLRKGHNTKHPYPLRNMPIFCNEDECKRNTKTFWMLNVALH